MTATSALLQTTDLATLTISERQHPAKPWTMTLEILEILGMVMLVAGLERGQVTDSETQ